MEPYTVALTSCGRLDLLELTLRSLLPKLDGPVADIVVSEDSGGQIGRDIAERVQQAFGSIRVIVNDPPIGQIGSIDRLYSQVTTEWVFHCEDDWEFYSDGFMEKSFSILKERDHISMVALRRLSDYPPSLFGPLEISSTGIPYRIADSTIPFYGEAAGLHFNPGLRRMTDYRVIGPYVSTSAKPSEVSVSRAYLELGYRVACLDEPATQHIGAGRHVRDPFQSYGVFHRLGRSMRKRLLRLQGNRYGKGTINADQ